MLRIPVHTASRDYEVWLQAGSLGDAGRRLKPLLGMGRPLFVVSSAPVCRKWGGVLLPSLTRAGFRVQLVLMPDGESAKRLATLEALADKFIRRRADRDAVVVTFGGGVVGDTAGLLASLFMRGVELVQIPTTVLAQVDSCIGGKTGVNLVAGKNLLGTFHQPKVVLIDPEVLATLSDRQYRAGMYEALKCGVIGDARLFRMFEQKREEILRRDPAVLNRIIAQSVRLKSATVSADERETGVRQVLNFGHTLGHAFEAQSGYRMLHGEAVARGMVGATRIAELIGWCDAVTARRIRDAVVGMGTLPPVKFDSHAILRRLRSDKKARGGQVRFVLPRKIGEVHIVAGVPSTVVIAALEAGFD